MVPLRFLSYRYKTERSVAFKIAKIRYRPGLCPRPRWGGAHDAPADPLVGWRGDTPHHTTLHSAVTHLRRSPCVSLRIPARSTPMVPAKIPGTIPTPGRPYKRRVRCSYVVEAESDSRPTGGRVAAMQSSLVFAKILAQCHV